MKEVGLLFVLGLLLVAFPTQVEGNKNTSCAVGCQTDTASGLPFDCIGPDGGGCCSEFIPAGFMNGSAAFCAHSTYCMVEDYTCCGCQIINLDQGIWECGGCPKDSRCVYPENNNGTRKPGTRWYCNSGAGLLPNFIMAVVVSLFASFMVQLGKR